MTNQDWLVTDDGQCRPLATAEIAEPERTYRVYRCVEPLGDEPTVSFNLYGITDHSRYQFDPAAQTAEKF